MTTLTQDHALTATLTQDHVQTARDHLAAADTAFASGDNLGGSKKMWDAAASALKAVVEPKGWRCESHEDLFFAAKRLANETGDDMIMGEFIGPVSKFYDNFQYDYMDDEDDFDITRELARNFIFRVLALIDAGLDA